MEVCSAKTSMLSSSTERRSAAGSLGRSLNRSTPRGSRKMSVVGRRAGGSRSGGPGGEDVQVHEHLERRIQGVMRP